jgi:hypothetical protein
MHSQLTYLMARQGIQERVARAERERLGALALNAQTTERGDRGRIISLRASRRRWISRRAAAEGADQR